jgi:GNAT superfamily N-acetyltransferase
MTELSIRPARADDCAQILSFIQHLAEYERLAHACVATEEQLRSSLFGTMPYAEALLAFEGDTAVGFALFFHNYSTFLAKPGIYLEDLFVEPEHRGKGYGKALLRSVAALAVERGCGRLEWSVLNWNTPAIDFYWSLGAEPMHEWTVQRVTGEALELLGNS